MKSSSLSRDSKFRIVYHKAEDQPQLIAKGTPHGNYDFLAQAFILVLMFELIVLCDEPFLAAFSN